jgi:hypothetical protein
MTLARQQVFDEYIKSKSSDLSTWMTECDRVWKEEGVMLPYPSFSFYPDEEEIISRAKLLSKPTEKEPEPESVVEEKIEKIVEELKEEEIQIPVLPTKSIPVQYKHRRKWK